MSNQNENLGGLQPAEGDSQSRCSREERSIDTQSDGRTQAPCLKEPTFDVTFFPDEKAYSKWVESLTLHGLCDKIQKTNRAHRDNLPWLKLAMFGDQRSGGDSLRNNANVLSITGIELDYDSKKITLDKAIEIAEEAKLRALFYTSRSYTDEAPKWRILLPTSEPLPPERREQLVARVNGLYSGAFAPESFVLSQSYYFGSVEHNPKHRAVTTDGDFIDLRDDLDAGAIGKSGKDASEERNPYKEYGKHAYEAPLDADEMLSNMVVGENVHNTQLSVCASLLNRGMAIDDVVEKVIEATRKVAPEGWNWEKEERLVRGMCEDWVIKQEGKRSQHRADSTTKSAKTPFTITAAPYAFPAETSIPQYDWLLGRHLLRGDVSGTAATGGTGKSSLAIVEALAMASGKQLTHDNVPSKPIRVVLINLEDKPNTMDKRIAAAMRHHGLTKEDIGDRLIVMGKGQVKFKIARQRTGDVQRNEEVIDALNRLMTENKADVLSVDSFIRTHSVNENDNTAVEKVVECFEEIAEGANCAVHLWHHNRKSGGLGASVESARGAQAFIDACRSIRILETMAAEEAKKLKIANRRPYFRSFNGKLNFALGTDQSQWLATTSVRINNGPALNGMHMLGDDVGVAEIWQHPGTAEADLSDANVEAIKQLVGSGEWRDSVQAGMWVGKAVAQILNLDPEEDKALVKTTIKRLFEMGVLKREAGRDERRKPVVFVVPCSTSAPPRGA